jgi:predicted ATPase
MRLARFSVENYRAFVDLANLELRPLTLLFGYNSAGKSALLRFLPIISASTSTGQLTPLALDTAAARGASFRDILSRQGSSPSLRLGLEWEESDTTLAVKLNILDIPERQLQIVERLWIANGTSELTAIWNPSEDDLASRVREYDVGLGDVGLGFVPISFDGVAPVVKGTGAIRSYLDQAAEALRGLRDQVHWLNSLRAVPARVSRFGVPPSRLAPDGANAGDYLAYDRLAEGALVRRVSSVFEKATGHRLDIANYALAGEKQYSIMITPIGATPPIEVPIVDTGEGMAQLLPVVVLGCLAQLGRLPEDSILAIEHPELHLHPVAHAVLAEFFCDLAAGDNPPTSLIETHSENFLLRVQIAIAKGDLPADKVIVHWIRALDGVSVVDTITFDEAARPQGAGWPPGVFSEDLVQARELLKIRKERGYA